MRPRRDILADVKDHSIVVYIIVEVLLDIRDALARRRG